MEGTNVLGSPYVTSQLQINVLHRTSPLIANTLIELIILESSRINAFCGSPSSEEYYDPKNLFHNIKVPAIHSKIETGNSTYNPELFSNDSLTFKTFPAFYNGGLLADALDIVSTSNSSFNSLLDATSSSIITRHAGCSEFNDCSGHGYCDYCYQK